MTYHVEGTEPDGTLCGMSVVGDVIIPTEELNDANGRYINCVNCHKILSGGLKHVPPPEDWTPND